MPSEYAYFTGSSGPYLKVKIKRSRAALIFTLGQWRRIKVQAWIKNAGRSSGMIGLEAVDVRLNESSDVPDTEWLRSVVDRTKGSCSDCRKLKRRLNHWKQRGRVHAQAARVTARLGAQEAGVVVTRGHYGDSARAALGV